MTKPLSDDLVTILTGTRGTELSTILGRNRWWLIKEGTNPTDILVYELEEWARIINSLRLLDEKQHVGSPRF